MILKKIRLDQILFDRKLAESKTKAQSMIMAGQVSVEGKIINKSGFNISPYSLIEIKNLGPKWVSRGAYKLIKALDENNINVENQVCLDLGASTGGFTDVLIQRGAKKVFSVDVGTNQLHEKLKNDKRVINISSTDIRSIRELNLSNPQIMVIDLSFISVTKALPFVMSKVQKDTKMICLIKPQFELSKKQLNKNGIVKNEEYIKDVILKIKQFFTELKWAFIDIKESPIVGRSGNKEFLLYAKKQ